MKLSIKKIFTLSILFAALVITLVSCSGIKKDASPVDATKITYDGKTVKWEAAENAVSYLITINNLSEAPAPTTAYGYNAKKTDDTVTVTIKSVGENGKEAAPAARSFSRLATITQIEFDAEGVMTWESIDGASSYIVEVNGQAKETAETRWDEFEVGKTNRVRVRATTSDGSTFSDFSQEQSRTYLAAPTNIRYDGVNLSWNGSGQYATNGYEVYIDGSLYQSGVRATSLAYATQSTFKVEIKALGEGGNSPRVFASPLSDEVTFTFLGLVEDLTVDNGVLVWSEIEGAEAYDVKYGTTVKRVKENKFNLEAGKNYTVQVKPVLEDGSTFFSDYSLEKIVYVLKAPVIQWTNYDLSDGEAKGNIHWDLVTGEVSGYKVYVSFKGVEGVDTHEYSYDFGESQKDFQYAFLETGTYTVRLQTIADTTSGTHFDSVPSAPLEVVRLAAPKATSLKVTSDPDVLALGFKVSFESTALGTTTGYRLYRDTNVIQDSRIESFEVNRTDIIETTDTDGDTINYSIQTLGNGNVNSVGGRNVVYLSSLLENNCPFEIEVMATPTNLEFSGYELRWNGTGSDGYYVEFNGKHTEKNPVYSLANIEAGVTGDLTVTTRGDGAKVLPSNPSESKTVQRLVAPTNIRVGVTGQTQGSDGNEGKLYWDEVLHANSYEVQFGNDSAPIDSTNVDSVYKYVTTTGTAISMRSVANYELDGTYYITSPFSSTFQMIRFTAPTFGATKIQNGKLMWNRPTNTNVDVYAPTYVIYNEALLTFNNTPGLSEFDIYEHFEGGSDYTLYVQAIGDGKNYINSEKSDPVQFYLLKTPVVKRTAGGYEWMGVANASSYIVSVEGVKVAEIPHDGVHNYTWNLDLSKFDQVNKTFKVTVQAIGNNNDIVSSKPAEIDQFVQKASTPEFTVGYSEEHYDKNGNIVVTITKESNYTLGYYYTVGGALRSEVISELTYNYNPNATGSYTVRVAAAGGVFDDQGTLYIASDEAEQAIILLSNPAWKTMTMDGQAKFNSVSGAAKYSVTVSYLDAEDQLKTVTFNNALKTEFTLSDIVTSDGFIITTESYVSIEITAVGTITSTGAVVISSVPTVYKNPNMA